MSELSMGSDFSVIVMFCELFEFFEFCLGNYWAQFSGRWTVSRKWWLRFCGCSWWKSDSVFKQKGVTQS